MSEDEQSPTNWGDPISVGDPPLEHVLAVYGTLQPGETNHHLVSDLDGIWYRGTIRGRRFINPSGEYAGYPAFSSRAEEGGSTVGVSILVSPGLSTRWAELDDFEGRSYRRVPILVTLRPRTGSRTSGAADPAGGPAPVVIRANVYEMIPHPA